MYLVIASCIVHAFLLAANTAGKDKPTLVLTCSQEYSDSSLVLWYRSARLTCCSLIVGEFSYWCFKRGYVVDLYLLAGIKKGDSVLPWLTSLGVGFVQRAWEFPFVTCCDKRPSCHWECAWIHPGHWKGTPIVTWQAWPLVIWVLVVSVSASHFSYMTASLGAVSSWPWLSCGREEQYWLMKAWLLGFINGAAIAYWSIQYCTEFGFRGGCITERLNLGCTVIA